MKNMKIFLLVALAILGTTWSNPTPADDDEQVDKTEATTQENVIQDIDSAGQGIDESNTDATATKLENIEQSPEVYESVDHGTGTDQSYINQGEAVDHTNQVQQGQQPNDHMQQGHQPNDHMRQGHQPNDHMRQGHQPNDHNQHGHQPYQMPANQMQQVQQQRQQQVGGVQDQYQGQMQAAVGGMQQQEQYQLGSGGGYQSQQQSNNRLDTNVNNKN